MNFKICSLKLLDYSANHSSMYNYNCRKLNCKQMLVYPGYGTGNCKVFWSPETSRPKNLKLQILFKSIFIYIQFFYSIINNAIIQQ